MGASVRLEPITQDDPVAAYLAAKQKGTPASDPVADYLAARGATSRAATPTASPVPRAAADASSALPRNRENPTGDYGVLGRGVAANVLNAAQGFPGMEAFEAAAGSLGSKLTDHPLSYRESLSALRSQTDPIPAALSIPEKLAGGAMVTPLLPAGKVTSLGQAVKRGAATGGALGAADQALAANPDESAGDRAIHTLEGGAIGAGAGALLGGGTRAIDRGRELNNLSNRVKNAPELDVAAVQQGKADKAANIGNYGTAMGEAAAKGGTTPAVSSVLNDPIVKPYAETVRSRNPGASDAEVLQQARKRIARDQRGYAQRLKLNYDPDIADKVDDLKGAAKSLDAAMSSSSQKPPITMDVAPEVFERDPRVVQPEREAMRGPIPGAGVERTARESAPLKIRDESGQVRRNLSQVADDELVNEYQRLAEQNATEEAAHGAVQDAGYRMNYEELPKTEKYGHAGREDLPDADGEIDPEQLLRDNKTVAGYNRNQIVRAAREKAMQRIEAEIQNRPSLQNTDFDFGQNVDPFIGPKGPAFQLGRQPAKVQPGVRIESPGMRVQTAPAEDVGPLSESWKQAVAERAKMAARDEAGTTAAIMTPKVMRGAAPNPKKLTDARGSLAAWLDEIASQSPDVAQRATQSTLGAAKQELRPQLHSTLFGTLAHGAAKKGVGLSRLEPVINALDRRTGSPLFQSSNVDDVLKALGVVNSPFANRE